MDVIRFCKHNLQLLSEDKKKNHDELFESFVRERLDDSYNSYIHDIELSTQYLTRRNELNVVKKLNKLK